MFSLFIPQLPSEGSVLRSSCDHITRSSFLPCSQCSLAVERTSIPTSISVFFAALVTTSSQPMPLGLLGPTHPSGCRVCTSRCIAPHFPHTFFRSRCSSIGPGTSPFYLLSRTCLSKAQPDRYHRSLVALSCACLFLSPPSVVVHALYYALHPS